MLRLQFLRGKRTAKFRQNMASIAEVVFGVSKNCLVCRYPSQIQFCYSSHRKYGTGAVTKTRKLHALFCYGTRTSMKDCLAGHAEVGPVCTLCWPTVTLCLQEVSKTHCNSIPWLQEKRKSYSGHQRLRPGILQNLRLCLDSVQQPFEYSMLVREISFNSELVLRVQDRVDLGG